MQTKFIVIDQGGLARPFDNYEAAKQCFDVLVKNCRKTQIDNVFFTSKYHTVVCDEIRALRFVATYKTTNFKGKTIWKQEIYTLQNV